MAEGVNREEKGAESGGQTERSRYLIKVNFS